MKLLKKTIIFVTLTVSILSTNVYASGIPVIDVASITEAVKNAATQAKQFKDQMQEARSRLAELKMQVKGINDIKDISSGNYDDLFAELLNDPTLSKTFALDDWKSIYNDLGVIEDLRTEFSMWSDDPKVQKKYDDQLQIYAFKQKAYESSVSRQDRIAKITNQFKLADNPAKKADLTNSLNLEMMQQKNDEALIARMNQMMEDKAQMQRQQRAVEYRNKLLTVNW